MRMSHELVTERELDSLNKFIARRDVVKAMQNSGQLAIVYGPSTGIGMPVTVTVKDKDGCIISEDITDYASW